MRLVKKDFHTFPFSYVEAGVEQKSEEMVKKLSKCCQGSEDGLSYLLSFLTWRLGMSRKVKKWLHSYPSAGRLVKMDFCTSSLFIHGGER